MAINYAQTSSFGNNYNPLTYNILREDSLLFVIEYVKDDRFNNLFIKAAQYAFFIAKGHVFEDGSKRTGVQSGLHFLELNGCKLRDKSASDIQNFALSIVNGSADRGKIAKWYESVVV